MTEEEKTVNDFQNVGTHFPIYYEHGPTTKSNNEDYYPVRQGKGKKVSRNVNNLQRRNVR